jgi:hypothetical protein
MVEFNTPITPEQKAFLAANKEELCQKDSGKAIWQNRVKKAGEAYAIAKTIHGETSTHTLVAKTAEDEDDDVDSTFPDWPTYRDNFILDWIGSRIVVTDKEADMIFDRTADEALAAIEQGEQNQADADAPVVDPAPTVVTVTMGDVPAVKRRGRPPGSGKKSATGVVKATKTVKTKTRKVAAKKKSGGSASAKAQAIIEKYGSRDWSRKDIITKLQNQLGMGAAYAATLYQKFA